MPSNSFVRHSTMARGLSFNDADDNLSHAQSVCAAQTPVAKKPSVRTKLRNFSVVPKMSLQKKLDYFYQPYNPGLAVTKYMTFGKSDEEVHGPADKQWKPIANLLLNEDLVLFRTTCKQINKKLYAQLSSFAKAAPRGKPTWISRALLSLWLAHLLVLRKAPIRPELGWHSG